MLDRYTAKAFFKVTAPFWGMGLLLLGLMYAPWIIYVLMGLGVITLLVLIGIIVKGEAARMRSDVYNSRANS